VLFAVLYVSADDSEVQKAFLDFIEKHDKQYTKAQFSEKFKVFKQNYDFIQRHNADRTKKHTVAVNAFADLTGKQFRKAYLGLRMDLEKHIAGPQFVNNLTIAVPTSYDWRNKKVVTAVKDQGQCGSCWSFSTTGSVEACHAIKYGASKIVALSEQNLIDCSVANGNQGCNGGLMTAAMDYIIANKGVDTEKSYPYTTSGPNDCEYKASNRPNPVATVTSYSNIPTGDEAGLLKAGLTGPVSVAIDASQSSFQFYSSGVYYEPECSSTELDHGVLMVGWGSEDGQDYWWVKNSWGASWGLEGYIKMARNHDNNCGIATMATVPHC